MSYEDNGLFPPLDFSLATNWMVLKVFSDVWKDIASKNGYIYSDRSDNDQYYEGINIYLSVPDVYGAFIYASYSLENGTNALDNNSVCLHGQWAKNGRTLGYFAWRSISEVCLKYRSSYNIQDGDYHFTPNPEFIAALKKVIKPIVRKQFESCDGKMKRLLAKQGR